MKVQFGHKSKELTGEICDGMCVRQEFIAKAAKLVSVDIYFATYKRENPGTIIVDIRDCRQRKVGEGKTEAAQLKDNSFREMGLGVVLVPGHKYDLRIWTSQCRSGQSVTGAFGAKTEGGALFIGARLQRGKELTCTFNYDAPAEVLAGNNGKSELPDPTEPEPDNERPPVPADGLEGLVSVVIPHYNCQDYLSKCLASLASQTYSCLQIIVVDDGSDNQNLTEDVVDVFKHVLPAVSSMLLPHNGGAPRARNLGAEAAKGEYLFFCDSDVMLYAECIETLVRCLLEVPGADFAYGGFIWGAQRVIPKEFNEQRLREGNYVTTMSLMRRAKFPGWDEKLKRHQDWDMWLTMVDNGSMGVCCGTYLFETPVREGSISSDDNVSMMESKHIVTLKHQLAKDK
jgi:hypothetical protein